MAPLLVDVTGIVRTTAGSKTVDLPFTAKLLRNDHGHVESTGSIAKVVVDRIDDAAMAAGIRSIKSITPVVRTFGGREGVEAETNLGRKVLALESRPWLRELVENVDSFHEARNAAQNDFWKAEQERTERPLLDAMERDAQRLRAEIPEGASEVQVDVVGDADGSFLRFSFDGVELAPSEVVRVGDAFAIRPGALEPFAQRFVAYAWPAAIDAARKSQPAASIAAQGRAAETANAGDPDSGHPAAEVPESAVAAYNRYLGDPDAAWEAEDERACMLIREWGPRIEAERLASREADNAVAGRIRAAFAVSP